jgi:thiol:disulfide interchange protein
MPTFALRVLRLLCPLAVLLIASGDIRAQDEPFQLPGGFGGAANAKAAKVKVSGVLDTTALTPGKPAKLAVVIDIVDGYYAQANPVVGDGIATTVEMKPAAGVTFGAPVYPPGQAKTSQDGTVLSVYRQRAIVLVPVEVAADAAGSDITLTGTATIQVCDTAGVCLFPEDFPIEVKAPIAAAGTRAATPNQPELFAAAATQAAAPAVVPTGQAKPKGGVTTGDNALQGYSIPAVFGIAFLVGIIFNIVPCVLPVLPLKAIGFYETAQHNRLKSVTFGLAFSLGVVASFAVLGLLVVVFKAFTWGEIFSNPWFSLVLVLILVAMAANMFGLFTINLPAGAYAFSPRHDTYFLFGILTAALSTPCTFGLFVSVLGVALTQTAAVGLLMVCTVGAGMAFPYLVLSATPEIARKFPRTGPWAELVKQSMAFMLLAVAVFFAQGFIAPYTGTPAVWWMIFAVVAAGGVFVIVRSFQYGKTRVAPIAGTIVAVLIIAPAFFAAKAFAIKPYQWQAYTQETLSAAQSAKQVVLIEFTASWCSNCHALEALVLNSRDIQRVVQDKSVTMIKADLSAKDAPGWKLLKDTLQAEGVPLTVIYSPHLDEPIQLTGFYSVDALKSAIEQAAKPKQIADAR